MTDQTHANLMRRMAGALPEEAVESPLTSSRAVRLVLTKAANDTAGLAITVSSVAEEVTRLDDALSTLTDNLMLVGLHRERQLAGLIAVDMQFRSAVMEVQTTGALFAAVAEDRAPTRTDKVLCDPFVAAFVSSFPVAVTGTPFEGWCDGVVADEQIGSLREAGLMLDDGDYRIVRMTMDFGVADRQGLLVLVLPLVVESPMTDLTPDPLIDWDSAFQEVVGDAPASLEAVLHRFSLPLAQAQALEVGTVLPLTGCSVNSVRLVAPDGQKVAEAKLGQSAGQRAVRLETAPSLELQELQSQPIPSDMTLSDPQGLPEPTLDVGMIEDASDDAAPGVIDVATP